MKLARQNSFLVYLALFTIASCNVIWSYIAMHLRLFTLGDASSETVMRPFFYAGYGAIALICLALPRMFRAFDDSRSGFITVAAFMVIASAFATFSYGQSIFNPVVLSHIGYVIVGFTTGFAVATIYPFVFRYSSRSAAVIIVIATHVTKRIFSVVFAVVFVDSLVLVSMFMLPLLMLILMYVVEGKTSVKHVFPLSAKTNYSTSFVVLLLVFASLAVVGIDSSSSVGVWIAGTNPTTPPPSQENNFIVLFECIFAIVLAFLTLRGSIRRPLHLRFQLVFLVVLSALFLKLASIYSWGGYGKVLEFMLASFSTYVHGMKWAIMINCIHDTKMPPQRVIGVFMFAEAVIQVGVAELPVYYIGSLSSGIYIVFFMLLIVALTLPLVGIFRRQNLGVSTDETSSTQNDTIELQDLLNKRCVVVADMYSLSNREADVLFLLAQGRTRMSICEILTLSEGTVKTHITHIYTKMSINSQQDLLKIFYSNDD